MDINTFDTITQQPYPPSYEQATGAAPPPENSSRPSVYMELSDDREPIISPEGLGPIPTEVMCPNCSQTTITDVRHVPGRKTLLIAILLGSFCGIFCFALPYCMKSCRSANHHCSSCGELIASDNAGKMHMCGRFE